MSRARKARLRGRSRTWAEQRRANRSFDYGEAQRQVWNACVQTQEKLGTDLFVCNAHMRRGLNTASTVRWLGRLLDAHAPGWTIRRVRQRYIVTMPGDFWVGYLRPVHDGHRAGVAMALAAARALHAAVCLRPRVGA